MLGDTIKGLSAATYSALTSAFRSAMKGTAHIERYSLLKSDKERRDYVASFVLGTAGLRCGGSNSSAVLNKKLLEEKGAWLMASQLAAPHPS